MPTAVSRGSYYQGRSKRFLIARGFHVEPLQIMAWIKTPRGFLPVKRDAFGSDLLAVSPRVTWFVQCKGGETWRDGLAAARREFAKYPLGPGEQQVILGWTPLARAPEILIVATGPQQADHAVDVPARRKPKALPLFARAHG